MFDPANTSSPQFGTAEYGNAPSEDRCHFCKQTVPQQYYRVGGAIACGTCAEIARQRTPQDTHSAYGRALLFGIGAAVLAMIGYATLVVILKGWTIGYISIGVGYVVGKAMMIGSKGLGGRRYQITAALLTYAAVSIAAVPSQIVLSMKHKPVRQEQAQQEQQKLENPPEGQSSAPPKPPRVRRSLGTLILYLALLGLASPFLELQNPVFGLLNLVILFVGIQFAWRITAGQPALEVFGPFDSAKPA